MKSPTSFKNQMIKKIKGVELTFPIHPFLFALFPFLFFYSYNISELVLSVLFKPLLFSLTAVIVSFFILIFIIKDRTRAGILVSLFLILFFSYGHIQNLIPDFSFGIGNFIIGTDKVLFPIWLSLFLIGSYYLIKTRKDLTLITKSLNVTAVLLVTIPLVNIVSFELRENRIGRLFENTEEYKTEHIKSGANDKSPDIYYIIFDRYAANSTLEEVYNYDNSNFTNYLTYQGFYVGTKSAANYPRTDLSLSSSLNFKYVNYLGDEVGKNSSDRTILYPLISDNRVVSFLKSRGYKYLHLGSWWEPTRENRHADINYVATEENLDLDEFSTKLLDTTIFSPLAKKFSTNAALTGETNNHRNRILYQFNKLEETLDIEGPKFIFAHILLPHEPYVFGKDCNPLTEQETKGKSERENYVNQLSCTNKMVKNLVNLLLKHPEEKPVIILQADEGPVPIKNKLDRPYEWKNATRESIKEKLGILNAYYLPGITNNSLYPSITPVNSFRIIFNQYFGTNHKLLPDRNYTFEDLAHYYNFIDVTEELK